MNPDSTGAIFVTYADTTEEIIKFEIAPQGYVYFHTGLTKVTTEKGNVHPARILDMNKKMHKYGSIENVLTRSPAKFDIYINGTFRKTVTTALDKTFIAVCMPQKSERPIIDFENSDIIQIRHMEAL